MKKHFWVFTSLALLLVVTIFFGITQAVANGTAEPGSDQDPLVTKSYVDDAVRRQVNELQVKLDAAVKTNEQLLQRLSTQEQTIGTLQKEVDALKSKEPSTASNSSTKTATGTNSGTSAAASVSKGVVNASALNVREKPGTSFAILTSVAKGETVEIISRDGDWLRIKTSKGIQGWALGSFITIK